MNANITPEAQLEHSLKLVLPKRRAGNKRARQEHPGVTIATQNRRGEKRIVLRFRDPRARQMKQCERLRPDGSPWPFAVNEDRREFTPIVSREAAKPLARRLSDWLWTQIAIIKLEAAGVKVEPVEDAGSAIGWSKLKQEFDQEMETRASSRKTCISYNQTWKHFKRWLERNGPSSPLGLTRDHLRDFVRYLRQYRCERPVSKLARSAPPRPLSPHSISSHARHLRAILNYGRKSLGCVRLDAEAVSAGLVVGKLPRLIPVSLRTEQLRAILRAAATHDARTGELMFPFLAFLMITGARRGEALALRFDPSSVGAAESWLDLGRNMVVIWGNKTARQRILPLNTRPLLGSLLRALLDSRKADAEYVFAGGALPPGNAGDMLHNSFKDALCAIREASGVHFRLKDFRSTCATALANSNVLGGNLYTLAGELGHAIEILQKHYANHVPATPEVAAAKTVEAALGIEVELNAWISASNAGQTQKATNA